MKRSLRYTATTLAIAGLATGAAQVAAHADGATPQSPTTAAAPSTTHGLGLDLDAVRRAPQTTHVTTFGQVPLRAALTLDAAADLTRYALRPGDQGRTNSCVAYATGYSGYGIIMNEAGRAGAPMAPMYLYSQINGGRDEGSSAAQALPVLVDQGIDTRAHYSKSEYDWRSQPDDAERANAAQYKLSGYQALPTRGSAAKDAIMRALSNGMPVAIGMVLHENFNDMNARTASDYSYTPAGGEVGGHETLIVGYTDQGVKVQNSWSSGWGDGGFYTLPWDFVNWGDLMEAHAMGPLAGR